MVRKKLLYVYCATRGDVRPALLAKLPPMPSGDPPRLIAFVDDIALVVADVPAESYQAAAIEARLGDLDWVSRCGAAHHAVADALAAKHSVVPFRLFTLFSSEARARATLRRTSARIVEALDKVTAKAEWALRISKPDPSLAIGNAKGSTDTSPVTGTSFLQEKAAARQAAAATSSRVRDAAADVFDRLAQIADESTLRSVDETPSLLLDAAFLVDVRRNAQFKRTLTRTAAGLLKDGCHVSLTGPWPPYSFVAFDATPGRG